MPALRHSAAQLQTMLADPKRALTDRSFWKEPVCRRWLDHASERTHSNIPDALRLAIVGVCLARRVVRRQEGQAIRHRCVLVRAFAVLGWVYCAAGALKKASHALEKAAALAPRCTDPDERSNVYRLQATLRVYQASRSDGTFDAQILEDGLKLAAIALREARSSFAEARARCAHGHLQTCAGDAAAGVREARRALELLGPTAQPYTHASATSLLVWALSFGEKIQRQEAIAHLEALRTELPQSAPAARARLLWTEALIYAQDPRRKPRARRRLDQARRKFLKLKMQAEAIAVTADQARIDPMGPIEKLCAELLAILDPSPIRVLVEALRNAHVTVRRDLAEQLRRAAQAPGLLPAPAWPGR